MNRHWMTIAKVQFQILTARFRRFRVLFFCIITALLLLWGFFGAPVIVAGFVPDLQAMGGLLKPYIGGLFDYIFLLVFGFFIIYQLSAALQNIEEGQHELLLATPIKEGDIFLGENADLPMGDFVYFTIAYQRAAKFVPD